MEPDLLPIDVRAAEADLATVDALARLQLEAKRRGCTVCLRHPSDELLALVDLLGLAHVLRVELER
jgi:ABC-type transporter Mla MlaB component